MTCTRCGKECPRLTFKQCDECFVRKCNEDNLPVLDDEELQSDVYDYDQHRSPYDPK